MVATVSSSVTQPMALPNNASVRLTKHHKLKDVLWMVEVAHVKMETCITVFFN